LTAKVIRGVCDGDGDLEMSSGPFFVGVDVGTGSARAALVACDGRVLEQAVQTIQTWNPEPGYYNQSSDNIWQSICQVVKVGKVVHVHKIVPKIIFNYIHISKCIENF